MKKLLSLLALVLTICSTVQAQMPNTNSPVGTKGVLKGREAIVVDLGGTIGKVAVATQNVGASDISSYGTRFIVEEVNDPSKNGLTDGWYVPSKEELEALYANLSFNGESSGLEWKVTESTVLQIPGNSFVEGGVSGHSGVYVSATADGDGLFYSFAFQMDGQHADYRTFGTTPAEWSNCAIRPFHKLPLDLADTKVAAKAEIDELVANETRTDVSSVGNAYKSRIDNATTCAEVEALLLEAKTDIEALARAKVIAKEAIDNQAKGSTDDAVLNIASTYKGQIDAAASVSEVITLRKNALRDIHALLMKVSALRLNFSGESVPVEKEHNLKDTEISYSADGRNVNFKVNGEMVTYPINMMNEMTFFNGTPQVALRANEDPTQGQEGKFYTTFYSGLEAYMLPEGVKAYAAEVDGDKVLLTKVAEGGEILPQGEAVLLYTQNGNNITMSVCEDNHQKSETNYFDGVDVAIEHHGAYMLSYAQLGLGFYPMKEDMKLAPNKAFLPWGGLNMAKAFHMVFVDEIDGGVNGIEGIDIETNSNAAIYSVSGIRQHKLQKGINIVNGKKVFVK